MNNFFSQDNIIMRILSTLCDLMLLNFLFLLCSLPLFTFGASCSAMYSVIFKMQRHENPSIAKSFFRAFRECFGQSTKIWVPAMLILLLLISDIYIIVDIIADSYKFLQYPIAILIFLLLFVLIFVFPQIAAFETPTKQLLKNAALLCISNFPITVFVIIIYALIAGIANLSGKCFVMTLSIMAFFGFALVTYVFSFFFRRVFQKLLPEEENEESGN